MKQYLAQCGIILWISYLTVVCCDREYECIEVGFARASFGNVDKGYQAAKEELLQTWAHEDKISKPSYRNLNPQLKNVTRAAALLEKASKNIIGLIRKTRVGKRCPEKWLLKGVEKHVSPLIQLDNDFAEEIGLIMSFRCLVGSPYPNVDGTCNHEQSPDQGAIGSKFLRLMPAISGDGGFGLRQSVNNEKSLPSARQVAQLIRRHLKKPAVTALFIELSHFIAMDTIDIPEAPSVEDVNCCLNPDTEECAPIHIDKDDPIYGTIKCLSYRRSAPAQAILGHRDFLSMVSTYLDANPVYGATNEVAFTKKEGYFGYLKYPTSIEEASMDRVKKEGGCKFPSSFSGCFGIDSKTDKDFSENLSLLLTLEHNSIAESLAEINPHFDDSLLYNEARRILIGQYDAIVYGEFVTMLVGEELAAKHTLSPGAEGPGATYIADVNPGILNSYALASYRNPSMITEWHSKGGPNEILVPRHYDGVRKDPYVDLLAMDIQRGRDHGLANYGTWRRFCEPGKHVGSWEDVEAIFSKEIAEDLKKLYDDEVSDLDLLIALLETPDEDGVILGKTFVCIVLDQFARLKTGNRLFWEFDTSLMTHEQRDTIRSQSSAASLLCRHLALNKVPKNPFREVSESNPEVDCSTFSKWDLSSWKDHSAKQGEGETQDAEENKTEANEDRKDFESDGKTESQVIKKYTEVKLEIVKEEEAKFGAQTTTLQTVKEEDKFKKPAKTEL